MSTTEPESLVADPVPGRVLGPLVPGLILATVSMVVLALSWWKPTPASELSRILGQPNSALRAKPLADFQARLKSEDALAADPEVALLLLRRTERLLARATPREEVFARQLPALSEEAATQERRTLLGDREYLVELLGTLSGTMLPVGLPLLADLARSEPPIEPADRDRRRRVAMQALGDLGASVERCDKLLPDFAEELIRGLEAAAERAGDGAGAMMGAAYLRNVRAGKVDMLGLEKTLAICAEAEDPLLRQATAYCARYWPGTPEQDAEVEAFLVKLQDDDGRGEKDARALATLKVRSQAALSLAWRGSRKASLDRLEQALTPEFLRGTPRADEAFAVDLVIATLTAILKLHQKAPDLDLAALRPAVKRLTDSKNETIQPLAVAVQTALDEKGKP